MNRIFLFIATATICSAQPKDVCYAFLARADIFAVCQGKTTQITRRGDLQGFAVSDEQAHFAFLTGNEGAATLVNLKTGARKRVESVDGLVSTCGGILPIPVGASPSTREIVTGADLAFAPYTRFRCSVDRKLVVGVSHKELYAGAPPARKLAAPGDFDDLYFNISPDGSKIAYFNSVKPLCVVAGSGDARCVEHETMSDPVSVSDAGETLTAAGTGKGCDYKNSFNFTPAKNPTAGDDECLGVGYWKPGMEAIVFLQEIGRNPQWIKPETARLLAAWSLQAKGR